MFRLLIRSMYIYTGVNQQSTTPQPEVQPSY